MTKSYLRSVWTGLICISVFFGSFIFAWDVHGAVERDGGIRLGPVIVHPGVSVSETYTDNYFLEPEDQERSDWITTLTPHLDVILPFRRHSFEINYHSDIFRNAKRGEYDIEHHYAGGTLTLDFPGGLIVKAGHQFAAQSNPPTFLGDVFKKFQRHRSSLEAEYRFSDRYSVGMAYAHTIRRFDRTVFEDDDYDQDSLALDIYYKILPKTSMFVEGGWDFTRYPERGPISNDSNRYRVWMGLRTNATAKIVGILKGGWTYKVWDDEDAGDNISMFGMEGDLYYDITPRTRMSLVMFRRVNDTSTTTTENVAYGTSYTVTGGSFRLRQSIGKRLSVFGLAGAELAKYNEEGAVGKRREDTKLYASVGGDYRLWQWLTLGFNYRYTNNDSNFNTEDFVENRVMMYLSFGL